ncbi:MAG TPA: heme-binding protein [Rhodoferax sp.]
MIAAAEKKAAEIKLPMNIAVVDSGGNLVAFGRMKDSIMVSIGISMDKAWIAAAFKLPTDVLATLSQPGQSLFGINSTNNGRIVIFGGGFPVKAKDQVIGGIGVSGGSVEQDREVSQAGLAAFKR